MFTFSEDRLHFPLHSNKNKAVGIIMESTTPKYWFLLSVILVVFAVLKAATAAASDFVTNADYNLSGNPCSHDADAEPQKRQSTETKMAMGMAAGFGLIVGLAAIILTVWCCCCGTACNKTDVNTPVEPAIELTCQNVERGS